MFDPLVEGFDALCGGGVGFFALATTKKEKGRRHHGPQNETLGAETFDKVGPKDPHQDEKPTAGLRLDDHVARAQDHRGEQKVPQSVFHEPVKAKNKREGRTNRERKFIGIGENAAPTDAPVSDRERVEPDLFAENILCSTSICRSR